MAVIFGFLSLIAGTFVWSAWSKTSKDRPTISEIRQQVTLPEVKIGKAISFDGVLVDQVYLQTAKEKILLEKYPVAFEPIAGAVTAGEGEIAEKFYQEDSHWYEGYDRQMVQTSFNCGTFAVGDFIGLHPTDVLDGVDRPGFGNPMQIVLDTFFEKIDSFPVDANFDSSLIESNLDLHENDIISFVETRSPKLMFVHSGRILRTGKQNLVLSKVGRRGPILLANLRLLLRIYPCSEIQIHRIRPNST